jgi:adenine-specific DNA-methyltransferase
MIRDIISKNESEKPNGRDMEILHKYFTGCFNNEGKFDIDKFKEIIKADDVDITKEGYSLNFLGKSYARLLTSMDTTTVIKPDEEHNSKEENKNSNNIYISGDNIDAINHLLKSYTGAIKCIYIDPPYNTGSDGFVYNDNFNFTEKELQEKLSISEDEATKIIGLKKDGSSSHSAWLMFMSSRLQLAKDLLTDDGVIFISIDDNEQANLKLLCDNIFGPENFVSQLVWEQGRKSMAAQVAINHEYCLVYCNNKDYNIQTNKLQGEKNWMVHKDKDALNRIYKTYDALKNKFGNDYEKIEKGMKSFYKSLPDSDLAKGQSQYSKVDKKGLFSADNISQGTGNGGRFDILHPTTHKPCKVPKGGWRFAESKLPELLENDRIYFGKDDTIVPCLKRYLKETEYEVFASVFYKDGRGASSRLEKLFGCKVFDNPKDEDIIQTLINMVSNNNEDKDCIVLDFFSGSATTAESVMRLNKEDGGKRKFILVQLPENLDENLEKAGNESKGTLKNAIDFLDSIHKPHTLDEIGMERIRRAAKKIKEEDNTYNGDLGFKHYTLIEPDENTIDKLKEYNPKAQIVSDSNTLEKFGKDTVLETYLVRDGYGLGAKVEEVELGKYKAYTCGNHLYLIDSGFDQKSMVALVERYGNDMAFNPENVILFGYSFTYTQTEMIYKDLAILRNGSKDLKLNIDIRY